MAGFIDYILILGITSICIYIIYRMIQKRVSNNITTVPYSDTPTNAQTAQLNKVVNTSTGSGLMTSTFDPSQDNSLRNFCIKSSFNSAFTGSYVNRNMVKYVLTRGCRFLDFEVFVKDGTPIVAYSGSIADPSFTHFTSLDPALSLDGVFSTIMSNAFTGSSPNPGDPLFIQLHIKSYLQSAYTNIAQTIASALSAKLYKGEVTLDTQIQDLMGKIVIIVDQTTSPGYNNYSKCTPGDTMCQYSLSDVVNMKSGSDKLRIYKENELMNQSTNPPDPDVYLMRIVTPNYGFFYGVNNCNSLYLIQNYGAQVVAQAFYANDGNLAVYEDLFKSFKSAFVPITSALTYIQGQNI